MMKKQAILVWVVIVLLPGSIQADLPDGLVGYWPFNGNANDESSGGGNHGTVEGATLTTDRFGNPDSAYYFDGNDFIDIGDVEIVTGNTMSVQAWFKTTTPLGYSQPLVAKLYADVAYCLGGSVYEAGKIMFVINSNFAWSTASNTTLNDGQWHHVVGVYDGTLLLDNIVLYVDCVLQSATTDYSQNINNIEEPLTIGARGWATENDYFEGHIDEVMIWDRPLTHAEVWELYFGLPPGPPPVADAGEDIIADANEEVILDASASYDPNGQIVKYEWTLLPDNIVLYSGQNNSFTTRALGRAEQVMLLTVTDNVALSSDDTVSIFNRRVAQMQAQINVLQQTVEENRLAMEQFNPLRKLLEELSSSGGIPGDVNKDGRVDHADLAILSLHWLKEAQ